MNETAANQPAPYSPTEPAAAQRAIAPPPAAARPCLYLDNAGMIVPDVDPARLKVEVKRKPRRSGKIYPHIYGPLHLDADGRHQL